MGAGNEIIPELAPDISENPRSELLTDVNVDQNIDQPGPSSQAKTSADNELDPELLSALGESMSDIPDYGEKIHENLAKLWLPLLKKGMPKESKDKLLKEYLVPENCRLLQAPKLNAEISAAIPDLVRNRDKTLSVAQQQLGAGISAINRGLNILLTSDDKL